MFHAQPRRPSASAALARLTTVALAALGTLLAASPAGAAATAAPAASATPPAASQPLPVETYFRRPLMRAPRLSPSGKYLAAMIPAGKEERLGLAVLDLADLHNSHVVASFADADILSVHWVNDDRLVFDLTDSEATYFELHGAGLFAVDRDGKQPPRRLIRDRWSDFVPEASTRHVDRVLKPDHEFFATVADGSNDVVVARYTFDGHDQLDHRTLMRLDTTDLHTTTISLGAPDQITEWALGPNGEERIAISSTKGRTKLWVRTTPDAPWTMSRESETFDDGLEILAVGEGSTAYATMRMPGEDTSTLVRFDLRKGIGSAQPLVALKGYDFTGELNLDPRGRLVGVDFLTDARGSQWFEPRMQKAQARVDALLPDTVNMLDCGRCAQFDTLVVASYSDRQPTIYRLYDARDDKLVEIAASRPWIDPARMARSDLVNVRTRDGLSMPVHVTQPPGKGPWPAVVLVHGGPYVRGGDWHWDPDAQFLASRGYLVVEPEYRGSTGFGDKWFRAGWKQWGLAMQDDIADATIWAAQKGGADGHRICIAGASYGGYATLMGLVRYPELYRCGVEWAGVTDIDLMYSINWSDMSDQWKDYGMPKMIGDRKLDAKQLEATSPLAQADRITRPLLMAHGTEDRRVPLDHFKKLRDAVQSHNPDVETIIYSGEGHGWALEDNDVDFWTHVEAFLDKHLKQPR